MHHRSTAALALALLSSTAGCSSKGETGAATGGPVDTASVTYYEHAKPILDAKCTSCHTPGGIAPFELETYESAKTYAGLIPEAVQDRIMPPWLAADGCTDYAADRSLDDAQIATLVAWVGEGAAAGDPAREGAPIDTGPKVELTRVDVSLPLSAPYTQKAEPDDYRCFVMDWPEATTKYVTGFRANPGNAQVVHHVIAFLAGPGDVGAVQALDDAEDGPGYTCFGGPGFGQAATWLGAWAPGSAGSDFPPDTGIEVLPGSKIVLQIHYNTLTAGKQPDQTSVDFKVDDAVAKEAWIQPWTNPQWLQGGMSIPSGDADVKHAFAYDPTDFISGGQPFTIYTAGLHMHTLGTRAKLWIERAGGEEECLLDIPRWDFHWQGAYLLQQPKVFNPGDRIHIECHWDNSQGASEVKWGESTTDEMCLGSWYSTR